MSCSVLMVAEKPSLAEAITKYLAPGGKYDTYRADTPVHTWSSAFRGQPAKFKFTSVMGHVYSIDFTPEYNSWEIDPSKLFAAPTKKMESDPKAHMCRHLQSESKNIDYLVLWLDCDREGENICFEVIDNTIKNMKQPEGGLDKMTNVYRAKFSAITMTDLRKAMDRLGKPNENEARAVDARQELDLKVGVAFTRFQTRFFQGKYGDLDSTVISYGPCQTPTLSFCVERHDRIQSFTPESFWNLAISVQKKESGQQPIKLSWLRQRVFDKNVGNLFMQMIKDEKEAVVLDVSSEKKIKARPHALNTVELLKFGSSYLGISPSECMNIAERLYTQGYISYPRTETSSYPPNFDIRRVLEEQSSHPRWGQHCRELLDADFERPSGGKDIGDHPPITPMRIADEGELGGDTWRVYDYITRTFIGSVSPNLKYTKTTAEFHIGKEKFECSGAKVLSPGFTVVMHWRSMSDEYMPEFHKGESVDVMEVKLAEGLTSPPDYLTESEVIELMEKNGIGTDASIPTHINNICQRNYVQVKGTARRLVPTNLGIVLIHGYQKIDPELSLPTMRSDVEQQLGYIASGKASHAEVLQFYLDVFKRKFEYFVRKIEEMDGLFEATFSPLAATGKPLSKCGKCKRYMKYISLRPPRLHCMTCDETYSLPQNGDIKLYRELTCPLDDFELVSFSTGSRGIGYPLCPYCYNHPPFENIKKGMGCNHCPHPACSHSMVKNSVCACPQFEDVAACQGRMILDATSAPRWKLGCNECNLVSSFVDTINLVTLGDVCKCGSRNIKVDFRQNQNREPLEGCIVCDEEMAALLETRYIYISYSGHKLPANNIMDVILMSTNPYLIDQVDPDDGYQFATTTFPENASTRLAPRDFLTDSRDPHVISQYPPAQQSGASQVECPMCTFYNYPELRECEMCGASIGRINAVGNDGDAITQVIQLEEYDGLKQGLRQGQGQEQRALWSDMGGFLCETRAHGNTPAGLGGDAFLYEARAGPAAYGNRAARAGDGLGKNRDTGVWEESEGVSSREEISFDERHQDEHVARTLQKTMDDEAAGPSSSVSISAIISTHDSDWEFARALQSMLDEEDRRLQEEAERDAELARNLQDEEDRGGIDGDDDENDDRMREGADDDDEFDEDDDDAWEDDDDDFSVGVEDAAIEILDETGRGLRQQEQDVRERPPEPEDKMCGICLEERGKLDYGPPTCSHAFCAACWSTYLSTVLRDKRFPCRCAALRCRAVVTPADAERLWSVHNAQDQQGDGRWREEVKEFRRLHEEATMDDKIYCPLQTCSQPLRFNPETARTPRLHCPGLDPASSTGHDICGRCLVPWHRGLTCEAFRELESQRAEAKNDDEHRTLSLIRKQKWQRCPRCGFWVGKRDGCNHIQCVCQEDFCYRCGRSYNTRPVCRCES